jgi:hypothetical protein
MGSWIATIVTVLVLVSDCRMRPPSCILWSWNWLGKIRHREKSKWESTPSVVFGGKSWGLHALTNKRHIAAARDKRLINCPFWKKRVKSLHSYDRGNRPLCRLRFTCA